MGDLHQAALFLLNSSTWNAPPPELCNLTMKEGYAYQQAALDLRISQGERQMGWKIGFSSEKVRAVFGATAPVYGYLMSHSRRENNVEFTHNKMLPLAIESELLFTLERPLHGANITPEQVLDAVDSVAPAFEIVEQRVNMGENLPLGVADNVMQHAFVVGKSLSPYPTNLDLSTLKVKTFCNDTLLVNAVGKDVIDHQIESLAWLARALYKNTGRGLNSGMQILSGSFHVPMPVSQGEQWRTEIAGVGQIKASFV